MLNDAPKYFLFYPQHDRSYIGNDVFDVNVFVLHSKLAPLYAQSPREGAALCLSESANKSIWALGGIGKEEYDDD